MNSASAASQQEDVVVLLDSLPHPTADAAEPFIVSSDRRVIIAYPIAEADFERFGPFDPDDDPYCTVLFPDAVFHRLGPPGENNLDIHPLAEHGLRNCAAHEVVNSSLAGEIGALENAEAEALQHASPRHFVFTFQHAVFECVASDYTLVGVFGASEIASREAFALVR